LEHVDPRIKIAALPVWAFCVVTVPEGRFMLVAEYGLILLLLLAANRRLLGKFLRRLGPALPMLLLLCVLLPFFKPGRALWSAGPLEITEQGVAVALRVATAALLCVGAMSLVWASTSEAGLLTGLRGVGLPAAFVGVIGFMIRYLHVLRPELHRLTDARAERTIGPHGPGKLRSGANVLGALFLRAHDRAERVADAMAARCFTDRPRMLHPDHWHGQDIACGVLFTVVIVSLRVQAGS
jgi:cobalt/nickel transport system permease protein